MKDAEFLQAVGQTVQQWGKVGKILTRFYGEYAQPETAQSTWAGKFADELQHGPRYRPPGVAQSERVQGGTVLEGDIDFEDCGSRFRTAPCSVDELLTFCLHRGGKHGLEA